MIEESKILLEKNWNDDQKILLKKAIDNMLFYKNFITKSVKQDIASVLELSSTIKDEYDILKNKIKEINDILLSDSITDDQIIQITNIIKTTL